jgi:hypothetical protein
LALPLHWTVVVLEPQVAELPMTVTVCQTERLSINATVENYQTHSAVKTQRTNDLADIEAKKAQKNGVEAVGV